MIVSTGNTIVMNLKVTHTHILFVIFSDQVNSEHYRNQVPSNKIIILGLAQHITETDVGFIYYILIIFKSTVL